MYSFASSSIGQYFQRRALRRCPLSAPPRSYQRSPPTGPSIWPTQAWHWIRRLRHSARAWLSCGPVGPFSFHRHPPLEVQYETQRHLNRGSHSHGPSQSPNTLPLRALLQHLVRQIKHPLRVRCVFLRLVQARTFHYILVASYGNRKKLVIGAVPGRFAGINKHHCHLKAL
jgi:hypothetical protein